MTVEQIVAEVRAMPPNERQKLRAVLDETPEGEATIRARERAFAEKLRAESAAYRVDFDETAVVDSWEFKPVSIEGKPISETIIEERR